MIVDATGIKDKRWDKSKGGYVEFFDGWGVVWY